MCPTSQFMMIPSLIMKTVKNQKSEKCYNVLDFLTFKEL